MQNTSNRRQFLATASAGAALSFTATSYARIVGANERISIGLIGCGGRGYEAHMPGVHAHDKEQNVEFTAVSDPWRIRRERAAAQLPASGTAARPGSSSPTATSWPWTTSTP